MACAAIGSFFRDKNPASSDAGFFSECGDLLQGRGGGIDADRGQDGPDAVVEGVESLHGATVAACDLRAGAAMVIAGLCAKGVTHVEDIHYIERGYQDFVGKLRALGADICIVDEPEESEAVPVTAG